MQTQIVCACINSLFSGYAEDIITASAPVTASISLTEKDWTEVQTVDQVQSINAAVFE